MAINTGKVISGGLLTGFVYNVFDMLWNFTVLQADGLAGRQVEPQPGCGHRLLVPDSVDRDRFCSRSADHLYLRGVSTEVWPGA